MSLYSAEETESVTTMKARDEQLNKHGEVYAQHLNLKRENKN